MINYINTLESLFNKLNNTQLAYLDFDDNGYFYRQESGMIRVYDLYKDIKKPSFLSPRDIQHNIRVLTKLTSYEDDHLISITPTEAGYYFQVIDKRGCLVYAQYIYFYSYGWLSKLLLRWRHPELVLKLKTI